MKDLIKAKHQRKQSLSEYIKQEVENIKKDNIAHNKRAAKERELLKQKQA